MKTLTITNWIPTLFILNSSNIPDEITSGYIESLTVEESIITVGYIIGAMRYQTNQKQVMELADSALQAHYYNALSGSDRFRNSVATLRDDVFRLIKSIDPKVQHGADHNIFVVSDHVTIEEIANLVREQLFIVFAYQLT